MNITNVKLVLASAAKANDTVLMEGLHGIGKSDVVVAFAKENGYHMETLFLSHQEVGDLIGMPRTVEVEGEYLTTWTKPIWLQRMEAKAAEGIPTILFLDELNRAPIDVRQTALQLVLERKIHEHTLPSVGNQKSLIVAAVNPSTEYQVDELDPALLDRFLKLNVEVDPKSWLDWSMKNNVNPIVRSYIVDNPTKLHFTPKSKNGQATVGATPRSWTMLGKFIDNVGEIPGEVLYDIIAGKIGTELGFQFLTYLKNYVDVVKVADVEKLVKEAMKKTSDVEKLGEAVAKLTHKLESIQKKDLLAQLSDKYLINKDYPVEEMMPLMAFLYSIEIELLNSYFKTQQEDNPKDYKRLAEIDGALNKRELFLKVVRQTVDLGE